MAARTSRLKRQTGGTFRLTRRDQSFLQDLAKVRVIAVEDADRFHYSDNKSGARKRLDQLTKQGLLQVVEYQSPGKGAQRAYTFADQKIARAYKSGLPSLGRRNAFHEVLTSRMYFAEGRPDSWKLEADMSRDEANLFRQEGQSMSDVAKPDAMYVDGTGQLVAVEADSGQYNKTQIQRKIDAWQGIKQVWGQPAKRNSAIENYSDVTVHRY
ncbi:hypothetical protein [Reinekea blandensis]|uniref:Replication protein n=1 Tax=Reinekea blandensis MED297 TaxID=314283 RepID=A4BJW6_9GAMM|nr:hypothetical protein [Reinekea blandensis]EAR07567.1 hypothetical protein MED297_00060 [Reinekea sp. MED297] [Reinekea blandensis MED297]